MRLQRRNHNLCISFIVHVLGNEFEKYSIELLENPKVNHTTTQSVKINVNVTKVEKNWLNEIWLNPKSYTKMGNQQPRL